MKYIKLFEDFKSELIVYHGGSKLTNDSIRSPIFTTPIPQLANWYASMREEYGENPWISTLKIKINNPLISKKKNFDMWIPILDELGIEYEYNPDGIEGQYFTCKYIVQYTEGFMDDNINDCIYIPRFVEIAIKHGYDGIYGYDLMGSGLVEVYIPFIKNNIKVLKTERFDWNKHDSSGYP